MTSKIRSLLSRLASPSLKHTLAILAACVVGGVGGSARGDEYKYMPVWSEDFECVEEYSNNLSNYLYANGCFSGLPMSLSSDIQDTSSLTMSYRTRTLADGSISYYGAASVYNKGANAAGGLFITLPSIAQTAKNYQLEFDFYSGSGSNNSQYPNAVVVRGSSTTLLTSFQNNSGNNNPSSTAGILYKGDSTSTQIGSNYGVDGRSKTGDNSYQYWYRMKITGVSGEIVGGNGTLKVSLYNYLGETIFENHDAGDFDVIKGINLVITSAKGITNYEGIDNVVLKLAYSTASPDCPIISVQDTTANKKTIVITASSETPDGYTSTIYYKLGENGEETAYTAPFELVETERVFAREVLRNTSTDEILSSGITNRYIFSNLGAIALNAPTTFVRRGLNKFYIEASQDDLLGKPTPVIHVRNDKGNEYSASGRAVSISVENLDAAASWTAWASCGEYSNSDYVEFGKANFPYAEYAVVGELDYTVFCAANSGGISVGAEVKASDTSSRSYYEWSISGHSLSEDPYNYNYYYYIADNAKLSNKQGDGLYSDNRDAYVYIPNLRQGQIVHVCRNYNTSGTINLTSLASSGNDYFYTVTADGYVVLRWAGTNWKGSWHGHSLYGIRIYEPAVVSVDGIGYLTITDALSAADMAGIDVITVIDTSAITVAPDGWSFYDSVTLKRNPVVIFEDTGTGGSLVVSANGEGIASGAKVGFGTEIAATVTRTANYRSATVTLVDGSAVEHSETTGNASATVNYTVVADDLGKTITISTSGVLKEYRTLSESFDIGVASVAYKYNDAPKTLAQINSLFDYGGAGESAKSRSVEATITPASGYRVVAATVNSEAIDVNDNVCTVTWAANVKDITFAVSTVPIVTVTIPSVANATAAVTVGGVPQVVSDNACVVDVGAEVTVTYTADDGYYISSGSASQTFTATSENAGTAVTAPTSTYIMAMVGTTPYATMTAAAEAASAGDTIRVVGDYTSGNLSFGPVFAGKTIEFTKKATPNQFVWIGTEGSEFDSNWLTFQSSNGNNCGITQTAEGNIAIANGTNQKGRLKIKSGLYHAYWDLVAGAGANSTAYLTIDGGRVETHSWLFFGQGENSTTRVVITNNAELVLAYRDGSVIDWGNTCLATGKGADAKLTIDATGSMRTYNMLVCDYWRGDNDNTSEANGVVEVNDGGTLEVSRCLNFGRGPGAKGTVSLNAGGIFKTSTIRCISNIDDYSSEAKGTGTLNLNGGTIMPLAENADFMPANNNLTVALKSVLVDSPYNTTVGANITKAAITANESDFTPAITKKGSGALTFTGSLPSGTVITVQKNGGSVIVAKSADIALGDCTVVASESDTTKTLEYSAPSVTVSGVTATYGADFATADVTVAMTGATAGQSYTMTVGGKEYSGTAASNGSVTFSDVATGHASAYDSFSYAITSDDASVSGGSGSKTIADETAWFQSNSTKTEGGEWENALSWSEGKATVGNGNQFTPVASDASVVDVTLQVCFGDANNDEIGLTGANAAVKVAEVNDLLVFQALNNGTFVTLTGGDAPNAERTYNVALHLDYAARKYTVKIDDTVMRYEGSSETDKTLLAMTSGATAMSAVAFAGQGTLTSLVGETSEGYVAMDAAGNRYVSLEEAMTEAGSDRTKLPLTVLHDGTFANETYEKSAQVLPTGVNNVSITAASQEAADAAAANMEIALTSAQVTQGLKKDYYKAVATKSGEGDTYTLSIELDESEVAPTVAADEDDKAMEVTTSSVSLNVTNTKVGLYYGIAAGDTPEAAATVAAGTMKKCDTDGQDLNLTADMPTGVVKYYKVIVDDKGKSN